MENPHRTRIRMRPFSKQDWYGWAGAEGWGQDEDRGFKIKPWINEGKFLVTDWPLSDDYAYEDGESTCARIEGLTVIADRHGIGIHGIDGWAMFPGMVDWERNLFTPAMSKLIAEALPNPCTVRQLRKLGFKFGNFSKPGLDQELNQDGA